MAKGYNRINKLKRIIQVQDEYLKHANSGQTTRHIYRTYIEPAFLISISTFYVYLATPAKRDLEKLMKQKDAESNKENR